MAKKRAAATILEAARALSGQCDGAVARDGVGFNGSDSPFAKSVLEQAWLTQKQLDALHRMLRKYKGQLSGLGYEYDALAVPKPGPVPGCKQASLPKFEPVPPITVAQKPATVDANFLPPWRPRLPWVISAAELVAHFPAGMTPRPQQLEALAQINSAFLGGKRVVVLEMPTGGGKSVLGMTVARAVRAMDGNSHFLTSQRILQIQYAGDFPSPEMEVLQGRSNYPCSHSRGTGTDCANAPCTALGKGILPECIEGGEDSEIRMKAVRLQLPPSQHLCPYWKQLQVSNDSKITLFNFSSFLFQQRIGRFGGRDLMMIDEGHNIESQLMGFVSLELTQFALSIINVEIDREISTKEQLVEWMREKDIARKLDEALGGKDDTDAESFEGELDRVEAEALKALQGKVETFLRYVEKSEWVFETVEYKVRGEPSKKILARPLYAKDFAQDLLFSKADRILVMSATILDVDIWAKNLGLKREEVALVQTPCDFPVENRPIHLEYAGNMGRKWFSPEMNPKNPTRPKFILKIKEIMKRHAGHRGIIHCQSFELSSILREEVADPRFLFQGDFDNDKQAMLAEHGRKRASVIVAPSMAEGLDLKDDLARFQVIAKIPWPSLGDKVIKERAARDEKYYAYLTALKLVQSYGRIVRSKDDWGHSYIVDTGFESFFARNYNLIPGWVREAIRNGAPEGGAKMK
jgi:Rad3-related DNA helicase